MGNSHGGLIRPYAREIFILSKLFDVVLISGLLWFLCWLFERPWQNNSLAATLAVILFLFWGGITKLYRSWRSQPMTEEFSQIYKNWLGVIIVLLLLAFALKVNTQYSRLVMGIWFIATPLLLCLWRFSIRLLLRTLRNQGYNTRKVAVVGGGELGAKVVETINRSPWMGLRMFGIFDDRIPHKDRVVWSGSVQGNFEKLLDLAHAGKVDLIYITLPLNAAKRILTLLEKLADTTVSVYVVPELFISDLMQRRWVNLDIVPTISVFETSFFDLESLIKRFQDIIIASLLLLIAAVPMLFFAIAIKLSSPGPILIKKRRYGLDGRVIMVRRFRTTKMHDDENAVSQTNCDDSQFTKIGAFLKRNSLDELPQLINVLQGSMSIVGPKPYSIVDSELYYFMGRGYIFRHKVKPGIIAWDQVNGSGSLEKIEKRVEQDLWYVQNWSLWLDWKIILITLFGRWNFFSSKKIVD